jgi:hypothetical protein
MLNNDLQLSADQFKTLCKKWWSMEEYHKSLKQTHQHKNHPIERSKRKPRIYSPL